MREKDCVQECGGITNAFQFWSAHSQTTFTSAIVSQRKSKYCLALVMGG